MESTIVRLSGFFRKVEHKIYETSLEVSLKQIKQFRKCKFIFWVVKYYGDLVVQIFEAKYLFQLNKCQEPNQIAAPEQELNRH